MTNQDTFAFVRNVGRTKDFFGWLISGIGKFFAGCAVFLLSLLFCGLCLLAVLELCARDRLNVHPFYGFTATGLGLILLCGGVLLLRRRFVGNQMPNPSMPTNSPAARKWGEIWNGYRAAVHGVFSNPFAGRQKKSVAAKQPVAVMMIIRRDSKQKGKSASFK